MRPNPSTSEQLASLGERLAGIRLSRNLTQKDLADKVGTTRHTVMRMERGEAISLDTFIRILMALNLPSDLRTFLPDPTVRPVDRVRLHGLERQRARSDTPAPKKASDWAWGEEIDE